MRDWLRRIHIWLSLLGCVALITFGAAGLSSVWNQFPWRPSPSITEREIPFQVPPGADDLQVAGLVHATLRLPMSHPLPERALRRDGDGNLTFTFYTPNVDQKVTVDGGRGVLVVRSRPVDTADYLNRMHATTGKAAEGRGRLLALWSYYVEFSVFIVLLLPLTGVYLWLAVKPRDPLAMISFFSGLACFVLIWILVR